MTFATREEAEAVVEIATEGRRAEGIEDRWFDHVQAAAYPLINVGSLAERHERVRVLVKDAGQSSAWLSG